LIPSFRGRGVWRCSGDHLASLDAGAFNEDVRVVVRGGRFFDKERLYDLWRVELDYG